MAKSYEPRCDKSDHIALAFGSGNGHYISVIEFTIS